MALLDDIREYWDADASVYDSAPHHRPVDPGVRAAWAAALARQLPPPPARILDCGAGTGFLTLTAARLGHVVVALDISTQMLEYLRAKADAEGLRVETVVGGAERPPHGPFDVVMERHLLWTLGDPVGTLRSWLMVAPEGRLLLVEGLWGGADPVERLRSRVRDSVGRLLGHRRGHHAPYPTRLLPATPLSGGTTPSTAVRVVERAGWRRAGIERLTDVEWATRLTLPMPLRPIGVSPAFVVVASA